MVRRGHGTTSASNAIATTSYESVCNAPQVSWYLQRPEYNENNVTSWHLQDLCGIHGTSSARSTMDQTMKSIFVQGCRGANDISSASYTTKTHDLIRFAMLRRCSWYLQRLQYNNIMSRYLQHTSSMYGSSRAPHTMERTIIA